MTTIVYRDGILAADSLIVSTSGARVDLTQKIEIMNLDPPAGRWAIGFAGNPGWIPGLRAWAGRSLPEHQAKREYPLYRDPGDDDQFGLIAVQIDDYPRVMHADRPVLVAFSNSGWIQVSQEYAVIGAGEPYARGALEHGASAVEAVEVAARLDVHTGGPVNWIDVRTGERGVHPAVETVLSS